MAATLESVDQAPGELIPVSRTRIEDGNLSLEMKTLSASYEGRFDAGQDAWVGTWRQGTTLPLIWTRGPVPSRPTIDGLDGIWRGTLERSGTTLRLILHISSSSRGTRAKLDSPDMGIAGLDVIELSRQINHVHLRVPLALVVFEGELTDKAMSLSGPWRREGQPVANVKFARSTESPPLSDQRPQTPHAPFGYAVEAVTFSNPQAHIELAGTLTCPQGPGPFPAAILVSGSGPEDRDESGFGHKPFAVLADHLTREGIAVLRFDDRGVEQSGGDFGSATTADFASDVRAAVTFLASQPKINRRTIGLIGHSQGGVVGPIAAVDNPSVAYLVLLAAPATSMTDLLLSQRRMTGVLQGLTEASLAADEPTLTRLYKAVAKANDRAEAQAQVSAMMTPNIMKQLGISETMKPATIDQLTGDWLRVLLHYDATATLSSIHIPVLALDGSLDQLVQPAPNLAAIRNALANNQDATVRLLPGLNHMFQTARSGAIVEYRDISETFSPQAMQLISDWINSRFGAAGTSPSESAMRLFGQSPTP